MKSSSPNAGKKQLVKGEVLDASALLALLQREPGGENVTLQGSVMNSVNFAEVVQKTAQRGKPTRTLLSELTLLGLSVLPFSPEQGVVAGELYLTTKEQGLSLADRACLATTLARGGVAVTADRNWQAAEHGAQVRVIR